MLAAFYSTLVNCFNNNIFILFYFCEIFIRIFNSALFKYNSHILHPAPANAVIAQIIDLGGNITAVFFFWQQTMRIFFS